MNELIQFELKKLQLELDHWIELLTTALGCENEEVKNMYIVKVNGHIKEVQNEIAKLIKENNENVRNVG